MTEPKKENGANLPMIGLGLILAAGAGVAVGWYAHKPSPVPATAPAKPGTPAERAAAGAPTPATTGTAPATADGGTAPSPQGPCADWSKKICDAAGATSSDCKSITRASVMMSPAACQAALGDVQVALTAIDQAKASCTELQTRLCHDIGEDTDSCKLVKQQTPNFPPDRCQMMLGQYDDVLKDLQRMEARNKPLAPEIVAKLAAGDHVASFGPDDAKVVVVEFSDFLCPFCKFAAQSVEKIRDRYMPVVHFVFRPFPLPMHGDNARLGALAAFAALAQGKFWEMHDKLFEGQDKLQQQGRAFVDQCAQEIGLNMDEFKAAMDAKTFDADVTSTVSLGDEAGVDGTPTFFLNGKRMQIDPRDPASLSKALDDALTAAGVPIPPAPPGSEQPAAPPAPAPAPAPAAAPVP